MGFSFKVWIMCALCFSFTSSSPHDVCFIVGSDLVLELNSVCVHVRMTLIRSLSCRFQIQGGTRWRPHMLVSCFKSVMQTCKLSRIMLVKDMNYRWALIIFVWGLVYVSFFWIIHQTHIFLCVYSTIRAVSILICLPRNFFFKNWIHVSFKVSSSHQIFRFVW